MILKKLFFALIPLSFIACKTHSKTSISGKVEEGIQTIYLSRLEPQEIIRLDTMDVSSGEFSFEIENIDMGFYMIETDDGYRLPLFVKPGEKIDLSIRGRGNTRNYTVKGSDESERIIKITNVVTDAMVKIDSINTVNQTYRDSASFLTIRLQLDSAFENIVQDSRKAMKALIEEKSGSMANLFVFPQSIGNFQLVSPEENMKYYEIVLTGLEENYPDNKHTENFKERVKKLKETLAVNKWLEEAKNKFVPGAPMSEIELPGPDGIIHKLSSLRGKVVLVDFWAAWCRPCRAENPNLVRMYNRYKSKDFDVYSVSLDGLPQQLTPKDDWQRAINDDGLVWPNHGSELKGWNSSVVRQFGFSGIPYTILVDRDGNIIAVNLVGLQLEAKLKEVLG